MFFLADGEKFSKMADGRNNLYLGEKLEQKLNIIFLNGVKQAYARGLKPEDRDF
jgi:hypothetical protein